MRQTSTDTGTREAPPPQHQVVPSPLILVALKKDSVLGTG